MISCCAYFQDIVIIIIITIGKNKIICILLFLCNVEMISCCAHFQDKNPFSGFSEEHLNKLDEFLSSEEAKKILQQTTEGDFTSTMSDLATTPSTSGDPAAEVLGDDILKMLDVRTT